MIKAENGNISIQTKDGVAGVLTDFACIVSSVHEVIAQHESKELADKLMKNAYDLAFKTEEELREEEIELIIGAVKNMFK